MARQDPTFTGNDIIRLWCHNIDEKEKKEVFLFFFLIVPGILLTNAEIISIFEIFKELFPGFLQRLIVTFAIKFLKRLRIVINSVWADIIFSNELTRKEVIRCIETRVERK